MRTRHHSGLAALLVIAGVTADGRAQTSQRSPMAPSPTGWKQAAYIKASNPGEGNQFGYAVALSGDGNTLAVGAHMEDSGAKGINGNQADHSVFSAGAVYVFARSALGSWSQQAYVKASNPRADDQFGFAVALSADGNNARRFRAVRGRRRQRDQRESDRQLDRRRRRRLRVRAQRHHLVAAGIRQGVEHRGTRRRRSVRLLHRAQRRRQHAGGRRHRRGQ